MERSEPTTAVNIGVLVALMALLAATIGLALIDVDRFLPGHGWGLPLAMAIACLKAALVVAYFMHLRYGERMTRVFAAAGFVWLGLMLTITMIEVATRQ
jgi:cytochrome c oxidase subunit 4